MEHYESRGEYGYKNLEAGEREANLRLQAEDSLAKRFSGAGNVRTMQVGATFELANHPAHDRDSPNDREFVLLALEHEGKDNLGLESKSGTDPSLGTDPGSRPVSPGTYANRFEAIRKVIEHRPARRHAKPQLTGTQSARITGPKNAEVFSDRLNRVRVLFHWDRQAGDTHERDERSSCWVRVSTPNADADWGGVFVPRVGQEVVVSFLDGDPDRPLVTGRVYKGPRRPSWHSEGKLAGLKSKELAGAAAACERDEDGRVDRTHRE